MISGALWADYMCIPNTSLYPGRTKSSLARKHNCFYASTRKHSFLWGIVVQGYNLVRSERLTRNLGGSGPYIGRILPWLQRKWYEYRFTIRRWRGQLRITCNLTALKCYTKSAIRQVCLPRYCFTYFITHVSKMCMQSITINIQDNVFVMHTMWFAHILFQDLVWCSISHLVNSHWIWQRTTSRLPTKRLESMPE